MHPIEIRLFGGFEITAVHTPTPKFPTQKARALFVYLALHPHQPISRDTLAALLWPDAPADKAAHSLRQALSLVRRTLKTPQAPAPIKSSRDDVLFVATPEVWVDVLAFEQQISPEPDAVIDLYRGDLLAGVRLKAAAEFDDWLAAKREQLRMLAIQGREALADTAVSQAHYPQAQHHLRQALAIDPWHETAHRSLMRILALQGDSAAALAQYEQCVRLLQEGLGVEPLPITTQLYEKIKAGKLLAAPPPPTAQFQMPFVGREAIHSQLVTQFSTNSNQQPHFALIAGEAGQGKTRLVAEFGRFAQTHGALIGLGRCYEFGAQLPYQPIVEAMRSLLKQQPSLQLQPTWQQELSRLLPELATDQPTFEPDEGARQRLFTAVSHFFSSFNHPLVIVLDDLHWADTATFDLVQFLLHSNTHNLFLLGCYRPEEIDRIHPLQRLRRSLGREQRLTHLQLEPLTAVHINTLIQNIHEESPHFRHNFAQFLWQESAGNPFFLSELLQTMQELALLVNKNGRFQLLSHWHEQPLLHSDSLQDLVLGRVERLSVESYEALRATAVIGHTFDPNWLQHIIQTDPTPFLAEWQQRQLIQQTNNQFDFTHDKIRELVYGELLLEEARVWHGQIAAVMAQKNEGSETAVSAQLAHHYFHSNTPNQALPHLLTAVQQAIKQLAFDFAISLCTQALTLDLPPAQEMTVRQMRLRGYQFTVQLEPAFAETEHLLHLAIELGDANQLVQSVREMARTYCLRGDFEQARTLADEMLPILRQNADPVSLIYLLHLLGMLFYENPARQSDSIDLLNEAIALATQNKIVWMQAMTTIDQATIFAQTGEWTAAIANLEKGLRFLRAAKHRTSLPHGYLTGAELWLLFGQLDLAQMWLDEGVQLIEQLETYNHLIHSQFIRGNLILARHLALAQPQFELAETAFQQVLQMGEQQGRTLVMGEATYCLGKVAVMQGLYGKARVLLNSALEMVGEQQFSWMLMAQVWLARAFLQDGHVDEAVERLTAVIQSPHFQLSQHIIGYDTYTLYADALTQSGQASASKKASATAKHILKARKNSLPPKFRDNYINNQRQN